MICFSCKQPLELSPTSPTVCPRCGAVNAAVPLTEPTIHDQPQKSRSWLQAHKRLVVLIVALFLAIIMLGSAALAVHSHSKKTVATKETSHTAAAKPSVKPKTSTKPTATQPAASTPTQTPTTQNVTKSTATSPSSQPTNTGGSQPPPPPPNCTKGTYTAASAGNSSAANIGLQQIVDQPQHYTVYGYTADAIRTQMNQCTPVTSSTGDFDAGTGWWIGTHWNVHDKGGGVCTVDNAGIVIHVTSIYPSWSSSQYDDAGLASKWQTYFNNLTTHENGHRDIALQYTTNLYNGLAGFADESCSTINQSMSTYASNQLSALNTAENNYESQTNHGATQGAVFP